MIHARILLASALTLLLMACSSSSSTNTSGGDASTGTDGGGDSAVASDMDGGPSTPIEDACNAYCDAIVAKVAGGCPAKVTQNCKDACPLFANETGDCASKQEAFWTCVEGYTWTCPAGSDLPVGNGNSCTAQSDALSAACGAKDGGTD